jgi:intein-encoded DNA endonuclease-like protein
MINYRENDLINLLEFGVKTTNPSISGHTKRKDGIITIGYEFQLYGTRKNMESVINFKDCINFETKAKRKKLNKYLTMLQNGDMPLSTCSCT